MVAVIGTHHTEERLFISNGKENCFISIPICGNRSYGELRENKPTRITKPLGIRYIIFNIKRDNFFLNKAQQERVKI